MGRVVVSSADFLKRFRRFQEIAASQPVVVTSDGQESLVLLSAEEYRRLKSRDREALYAWELHEADLREIASSEPPTETADFDFELET